MKTSLAHRTGRSGDPSALTMSSAHSSHVWDGVFQIVGQMAISNSRHTYWLNLKASMESLSWQILFCQSPKKASDWFTLDWVLISGPITSATGMHTLIHKLMYTLCGKVISSNLWNVLLTMLSNQKEVRDSKQAQTTNTYYNHFKMSPHGRQ